MPLNPNARSFFPKYLQDDFATKIQTRYRGNKDRKKLTKKKSATKNRLSRIRESPMPFDLQRRIASRNILQGDRELHEIREEIDDLEYQLQIVVMLQKERLDRENIKYPDRDEKLKRGAEWYGYAIKEYMKDQLDRADRQYTPINKRPNPIFVNSKKEIDSMSNVAFLNKYDPRNLHQLDKNDYSRLNIKYEDDTMNDIDYYNREGQLFTDEDNYYNKILRELDDKSEDLGKMTRMDRERCKIVKKYLESNPMLYYDPDFKKTFIIPCRSLVESGL